MPFCRFCGSPLVPLAYDPASVPQRVRGIGNAAAVLLGTNAAVQFLVLALRIAGSASAGAAYNLATVLVLATVPMFIVWFFRTRQNAGLWGAQERSAGWAIGAWFTPVVNLWFPFQIATDAAAQHEFEPGGQRTVTLVRAWWAAWILAWVTGIHTYHSTTVTPYGGTGTSTGASIALGSTEASCAVTAVAAVLGLLMVLRLTAAQEARLAGGVPA